MNMEITRILVRNVVLIFGPIVLLSYGFGLARMEEKQLLWGGIPEGLRSLNVACMFIAAIGFLIMWWYFLYKWDAALVETLQWPWTTEGLGGHARLLIAFVLILIPSALWLELTHFHMSNEYQWTKYIVILDLGLVALGNVLLALLAWNAYQLNIGDGTVLVLAGAFMLAIQVIINDAVWWSCTFPW